MSYDLNTMRATVDRVVRQAGLTWNSLERRASEIVLFGSRATGVAVETSDWDLLFVGEGRSLHTHELDMIWISPTLINSERWLGSELASHIAAFGRWLLGCEDWRHRVHISPSTVARKQALVQFQLMELDKVWPALLPGARTRHIRRLRREVQRLRLLASGTAVPPAQHLDATWMKYRSPPEELEALFAAAEDRSWAS